MDPPSDSPSKSDGGEDKDTSQRPAQGLGPPEQPQGLGAAGGDPANVQAPSRTTAAQSVGGSGNFVSNRDVNVAGDLNFRFDGGGKPPKAPRATPCPMFSPWQSPPILLAAGSEAGAQHLAKAKEQLEKRRFAVIEAEVGRIAENLLHHVVRDVHGENRIKEAHYEKKELTGQDEYATIGLDAFLAELVVAEAPAVIVLNLNGLPDRDASSIRRELAGLNPEQGRQRVTSFLQPKQLYCVFICGHSNWSTDAFCDNRSLICFSLDEEEKVLIEAAAAKAKDPDSFADALRSQIKDGFWEEDKPKRLLRLYEEISEGEIERRVAENKRAKREKDTKGREYRACLEHYLRLSRHTVAADICKELNLTDNQAEQLVAHALFILTHVEDLTADDFSSLMQRLLAGRTTEEEEIVEIDPPATAAETAQPGNGAPSARQRIRKVTKQVPLEPVVEQHRDSVLRLVHAEPRGGRIGFESAFKAKIADDILRNGRPTLASDLLSNRTIERAVLLECGAHIAEKMAKAYADYIRHLPEPHREDRLREWMRRSARHFIEQRVSSLPDAPAGSGAIGAVLRDLMRDLWRFSLYKDYADRMSLLLAELLRDADTRPLVTSALDDFMGDGRVEEGKFDIVMHFIRRLRRHAGFDTLRWIKRLLSEGDPDAKTSALRFLTNAVEAESREGGVGADGSVLKTLRSWLSDRLERVTELNNLTAALLAPRLALCQALLRLKEEADYGQVTRLEPLIDLAAGDGLSGDADVAIDLLVFPSNEPWSRYDLARHELDALERLIGTRWNVGLADDLHERGYWRQLALVALLTEVIATVAGNVDRAEEQRLAAVKALLGRLADRWPEPDPRRKRNDIDALRKLAYDIYQALKANKATYGRARCAKLIGDELYRLSRALPPRNRFS